MRRRDIAPGVTHTVIRYGKVPRVIHVVTADIAGPASARVALAHGKLPGVERTSSMARRHSAVAAINGDFFRPSGAPIAVFAKNARLVQTPRSWAVNVAIARKDLGASIGRRRVSVRLVDPATGQVVGIGRVNEGRPGRNGVALFTAYGDMAERPPRRACSARLRREGPRHYRADGAIVSPYRVGKVRCGRDRMLRRDGIVIATPWGGTRRGAITGMEPGDMRRLVWEFGWKDISDTLGGNPLLVRNGKILWDNLRGDHYLFKRHPRTGVGVTKDGKLLLVTVDGRRPRYSTGMKLPAFARLMRSLGAQWALNLDGGGSTTMVVRGRVVNRPSDGSERPVASALLILPDRKRAGSASSPSPAGSSPSPTPVPTIEIDPRVSEGIVPSPDTNVAQQDPASMGGLASWLRQRGAPLDAELEDVARSFDHARRARR